MAMAMAGKQKNKFWRELRHKGGCCCFGLSVYALWAFYMGIWELYNPKLPIWPLLGYLISRVILRVAVAVVDEDAHCKTETRLHQYVHILYIQEGIRGDLWFPKFHCEVLLHGLF